MYYIVLLRCIPVICIETLVLALVLLKENTGPIDFESNAEMKMKMKSEK